MRPILGNWQRILASSLLLFLISFLFFPYWQTEAHPASPKKSLVLGDYAGVIRENKPRADGIRHVDTPRTLRKLEDLGVTDYFFLIWHEVTDWDDLRKEFLPAARKRGIKVWVYLVPPSEARRIKSEPYGTDYISWFRAVGRVSQKSPHLQGIVIDDFNHNFSFFNPKYVRKMKAAATQMNPTLQFMPQIYFSALRPATLKTYKPYIDGVLMTFRDGKFRNTQRVQRMGQQIEQASSLLSSFHIPLYLMVHASRLSATPASPTVSYVQNGMGIGLDSLAKGKVQGIVTYVLYKEWFPERKERRAHTGFGYGSLFSPKGYSLHTSMYGELKQLILPHEKGPYTLSFAHLSIFPSPAAKGIFIKQVLVDEEVVWQQEGATKTPGRWHQEKINVTPFLSGKKEAVLSFRLVRRRKGFTPWLYAGIDTIKSTGFSVRNQDFEDKKQWVSYTTDPSFLADTLVYDAKRRFNVFLSVLTLYTAYHLVDHGIQSHNPKLIAQSHHILQAIIQKRKETALGLLKEWLLLLEEEKEKENLADPLLEQNLEERAKKLIRILQVQQ